jgi:hypothetical protein
LRVLSLRAIKIGIRYRCPPLKPSDCYRKAIPNLSDRKRSFSLAGTCKRKLFGAISADLPLVSIRASLAQILKFR